MKEQKTPILKPIKCPNCGKRLLDNEDAKGNIEIKCPKCKNISRISLK